MVLDCLDVVFRELQQGVGVPIRKDLAADEFIQETYAFFATMRLQRCVRQVGSEIYGSTVLKIGGGMGVLLCGEECENAVVEI